MEFPHRITTSTHFWQPAQNYESSGKFATTSLRYMCVVFLSRSTREQRAHFLVHQLDSKTNLSKHTTHHPLIDVLQRNWWTTFLVFCIGLACCVARDPSAGSMVLLTQPA